MAKSISELENEVDFERNNLVQMIDTWDPVDLMLQIAVQARYACSNLSDTSLDNLAVSRSAEYVQSLYSSYMTQTRQDVKQVPFIEITKCVIRIYKSCAEYEQLYFDSKFQHDSAKEKQLLFQYEAQLLKSVRGHRYTIFHNQFFKNMLKTHETEFRKLFGIGCDDVVKGILRLEKSLRTAVQMWFEAIEHAFEKGYIPQQDKNSLLEYFNVKLVTGWPEELIRALSWEMGECKSFTTRDRHPGWPDVELPTQMRPFIVIDNECYCFDYYSFIDNIYRALAKAISRLDKEYRWSDNQASAAETFAKDLISKLLSGAIIYQNAFYRLEGSKKTTAESDIIAIYDNTIIFAEVKAGAYDYVAPIDDLDGHIKSLNKLMGEPSKQSMRAQKSLLSTDKFTLYDSKGNSIDTIDTTNLKHTARLAITVDNINTVASHIGQYQFVEGADNAICISLDELMVYCDLFDSPLVFLHFLFQRQKAARNPKLVTSDELDHLALYLNYPQYSRKGEKEANAKLYSSGFTQELDDYYYSKQEGIAKDKPHPQISAILSEILTVLNKSQTPDRVETANFLLDFSYEERKEFSSSVEELRKRIINSRKRACIYACPLDSNLPYVVFTSVPGLLDYTDREKEEKLLPQLKQDHYTSCWIFTISFHGTKIKKFDSRLFQLD